MTYPTQEELEAIARASKLDELFACTYHDGWFADAARRIIDWERVRVAKQGSVCAKHIGFDYLYNEQLVATYCLPMQDKNAPALYTVPIGVLNPPEISSSVPDGLVYALSVKDDRKVRLLFDTNEQANAYVAQLKAAMVKEQA